MDNTFEEPIEYPLGAKLNWFGACKPTQQWDPKAEPEAPLYFCGFSKASDTAQVEVFLLHS